VTFEFQRRFHIDRNGLESRGGRGDVYPRLQWTLSRGRSGHCGSRPPL